MKLGINDITSEISGQGSINEERHTNYSATGTPDVPPRTEEMYIIADSVPCSNSLDNISKISGQGNSNEERRTDCSTTSTPDVPPRTEEMYIIADSIPGSSSLILCDKPETVPE